MSFLTAGATRKCYCSLVVCVCSVFFLVVEKKRLTVTKSTNLLWMGQVELRKGTRPGIC